MARRLSSRKKKIWLGVAAGFLVVALSWWTWAEFTPRPLGDQLEYIGKRDYGCAWLCDSPPSTTYSYATDMTPPELLEYFSKARAFDKINDIDQWQDRGTSFRIHFFNQDDDRFTIAFRTEPTEHIHNFDLTQTTQPYVVEIESDEYQLAKDSL